MSLRVAWAFPGQGTEEAGLGYALASEYPQVRETIAHASALVEEDLLKLLRRGSRKLSDTSFLQPALTAVCVGIGRILRDEQLSLSWSIGHSLGELGALWASGAIAWQDVLHLSVVRGRLMAEAATRSAGGMLALAETSQERCQGILAYGAQYGVFVIAARHAEDLWTLSGEEAALQAVEARYPVRRLAASGAWHSSLMEEAVQPFAEAAFHVIRVPEKAEWISNATGLIVQGSEEIVTQLSHQLVRPIAWLDAMGTLERSGVTDVVLCGPHRVLQSLMRRSLPQVRFHATEHPRLLSQTLEDLRKVRSDG
ncbi:MAG: ACP S-malonyltransferase [Myxococcales bacterium]|nr:ACP S-malonyltransferase [Myxococcales bacterium]